MKWKVTTGYGSSIFLLVAVTTSVAGGCGQSSNKQAHDPSDTDDTGKGGSTSTSNGDGDNNGTGDGDGDSSGTGDGDGDSTTDSTGSGTGGQVEPPPQADGWSDFASYLVTSDGSHALGTPGDTQITGRDSGTKIIFFDPEYGSNETGEP
ncbi:MAG TPA: hypothetical protein VN764_05850, partial [Polyangiaceae bacterium]|nr:hypothetical protein [Polyangiaceae bacterium]